ncbi:MAG: transporter [Acidobacteriota bacterium]
MLGDRCSALAASFAAAIALAGAAAAAADEVPPIQDNSFLVEEAYNQNPGVVQHIQTFQRGRDGDWLYSFTQEWPAPGMTHQLSYSLSYLHTAGDGAATGIGDAALNYRYQLLGGPDAKVSMAPRFSLILPSGSARRELGFGHAGFQVNVPLSVVLAPSWVSHSNAGVTYVPRAADAAGDRADLRLVNLGQSLIWLLRPRVNLMLEATWTRSQNVIGESRVADDTLVLVSPGVRWSYNLSSGLQIVPGVAVPIGVGPSRGSRSIFFYLSFEHPFR